MIKNLVFIVTFFACSALGFAQELKLNDLFNPQLRESRVQGLRWMNDSKFYSEITVDGIARNESSSGKQVAMIFEAARKGVSVVDYQFSKDESKILIQANYTPIYRRSFTAIYYLYDIKSDKLSPLIDKKEISYATFSPDGNRIAYVRENNLYFMNVSDMAEVQLTKDGKFNHIINGSTDWVYEEEFGFAQAFFWSPDSKNLAFYHFDESDVKEFNMQYWSQTDLYPMDYKFKYPKAGEKNSIVNVFVINVENKERKMVDLGSDKDIYVPRVKWSNDANTLIVRKLNRLQNRLDVLAFDVSKNATSVVFTEEEPKNYVDIEYTDDLIYLKDGKHFLCTSERDGYKHIYLYENAGKLVRQITKGNWEVTSLLNVDESKKVPVIYFISTEESPLERHFYEINLDGGAKKKISNLKGWHDVDMSPDALHYALTHSSSTSATQVFLCETKGHKILKTQALNEKLPAVYKSRGMNEREFFSVKTSDNFELLGYMIKPANFSADKKYPVFMHVYGGPSSQQVQNKWSSDMNYIWHQLLAQKGYVVVCVDNRGTNARGAAFKKSTYGQLGKYETQDQIEVAKYLGGLSYVDKSRIGIWGWSYGGYMTSLCLTVGADHFKMGIAVAPVTTWRLYDTVYTERFLMRPQDNASGYDDNSPITHANKLKGKYLLVHGTADDNVHFQNAILLQDALIAANKQFDSFYYPNKNHGIYGGNTRAHLYQMLTNYVLNNL